MCGTTPTALGTAITSQTAGDCKKVVCDGAGSTTTLNDDTDPTNDNNACTDDVCTAGVPSHANTSNGSSCGASVTCVNGSCSGCSAPSDCPGVDDECKSRTCSVGVCGFDFTSSGTAVATQVAGNCQTSQCDGSGNTVSVADDADVPADDGLQCTSEVCTAGVPSHPNQAFGTACTENGGALCDGAGICVAPSCTDGLHNGSETDIDCGGSCMGCPISAGCLIAADCQSGVCTGNICTATLCSDGIENGGETGIDCGGTCPACPAVVSTTAADGASNVDVASTIAITFNAAMSPATLTAQTSSGACSGSVQVSTDGFATCLGIAAPLAFSGGDAVVTLTPAPGLSFGSTYKIKVTATALDPKGNAVAGYTSTAGFTTALPGPMCSSGCALNESSLPAEADYCVLQFPTSLSVQAGAGTALIYGRIFENGVTAPAGAPAGYVAQVGYGPDTSNPETQAGWQWFAATYNVQVGNDDEYQGSFNAPAAPGKYRYTYRFSADGVSWTYCDVNGAGSNGGLSFETTQLPVLTVTP